MIIEWIYHMTLSRDLPPLHSQLKRKISSHAISKSLVILNASGKAFQILGAKKQKEFVPCRTLFMRGIFRIFSEFLKLRVRQRFPISSRSYVGDKSFKILKVWIAMFVCLPTSRDDRRALFRRDSYEAVWLEWTHFRALSWIFSIHRAFGAVRWYQTAGQYWKWLRMNALKRANLALLSWQKENLLRALSCLPAFLLIYSVCIEKLKFSSIRMPKSLTTFSGLIIQPSSITGESTLQLKNISWNFSEFAYIKLIENHHIAFAASASRHDFTIWKFGCAKERVLSSA